METTVETRVSEVVGGGGGGGGGGGEREEIVRLVIEDDIEALRSLRLAIFRQRL